MDDLREVHISLLNIHDSNASLVLKSFECMEYVISNSGTRLRIVSGHFLLGNPTIVSTH